jgi:hypothetical protein
MRTTLSRFIGSTACSILVATWITPAEAASVVTTPALQTGISSNRILCRAVNAGSRDFIVTIELLDAVGAITNSLSANVIEPGSTRSVVSGLAPGTRYCRVTGIPKKSVKVTLCVFADDSCLSAVTAP